MKKIILEKLFACPRCQTYLQNVKTNKGKCKKCGFTYKKAGNIWHFLHSPTKESNDSLEKYNSMHTEEFGGPQDGSYEILASIARGNRTLDIACGEGVIEKLAPETVGVEFSLNALKKARANGAKNLVLADAHALPFRNDAFDIAISSGNLEHFLDPQLAIKEMVRISKIQVIVVHKYPPFPFSPLIYKMFTLFLKIKHQPIENPVDEKKLLSMMKNAGTSAVYKGVWTLPVNYGQPIGFLPEFKNIPSCLFVISIKK